MKAKTIEIDRDAMREERLKPDDYRGATPERLAKAGSNLHVADDRMGRQVYHLLDSRLNAIYAGLVRSARTEDQKTRLGYEFAALSEYYRCFDNSGMIGNVGSIDFGRSYSPSPFGRTFLSKTERQLDDRNKLYFGRRCLSQEAGIVVDNVVLNNHPLEIAAYTIGKDTALEAEEILREAGYELAVKWGLTARGTTRC